jgi:biopolymer transport protein TolR
MRQRRLMNQINVVPYIDVMLVLLVIFMVTAPMLPTGTVDVPSVAKASQAKLPPLEVVVKSATELQMRDRSKTETLADVSRTDLVQRLRDAQAVNPDQPVVIAADKSVRYEAVMQVMDLLQQNQIAKVGLLVRPAQ